MIGKRIAVGLVAGVALVSMAGCAGGSPRVAAVVDGQVITEAYLHEVAQANPLLRDTEEERSPTATAEVLGYLIWSHFFDKVFPQIGVEVTDEVRLDMWMNSFPPDHFYYPLYDDPRTAEAIKGLIDFNIFLQVASAGSVDSNAFYAAARAVDIELNPRYGVWDYENLNPTSMLSRDSAGPLAVRLLFEFPV